MHTERENLGVELYGIQQQLARQQMLVEKEADEHTGMTQLRRQKEETLAQVREMYRGMQDQVKRERQQSKCVYAHMTVSKPVYTPTVFRYKNNNHAWLCW